MDSFLLTDSLLRNLLRVQRHLQESPAAVIHITDDIIEFLDGQGNPVKITMASDINGAASSESRILLFYEDLQRIGDPILELEKPERDSWTQQIDYLYIRLHLDRVYRLYYTHGVYNLLVTCHLSANSLAAMNKEENVSLLEEV
ncbi:7394_t:CDS:2 [Dentiscutata heterogama]|uniref:7394_t:CDS:1 n=1 Tax=Dentiscutata heterogama TaxID=1316150 RepID=A0ACA9KIN2_9GLOM|nr:7394_t:CDS:2 [Dentiscutata heterogama]